LDILTIVNTGIQGLIAASAVAAIFFAIRSLKLSRAALQAVNVQIAEGKEQAEQERHDKVLPFLVPMDAPVFDDIHGNLLKWEASIQDITLRNMGVGIALNVASVLLGCESYNWEPGKPRIAGVFERHWTLWLDVPVAPLDKVRCAYLINNGSFREENRHVAGYSFFAPPEPERVDVQHGALQITARIILTYQDIFSRKYASIYDYVQTIGWRLVKSTPIEKDLYDLENSDTKRNSVKEANRVTYSPRIY